MKFLFFLLILIPGVSNAQSFTEHFRDSTLRIDYIFAGDVENQSIYVDELNMSPRWWGKRQRLADVPMEGNGQVIVRDHHSHQILYRNSFSTLFQEWLTYDEAKTTRRSFENVFLVPMPRDTVDISVILTNNRREVMSEYTHTVVPSDILIRHIGFNDVTPYKTLQQATDTSRCIHIAYMAEGYTNEEMSHFIDDTRTAMEALFEHEPFKSLRNRFNIVAVMSPSADSGTSEPSMGIWKNTALQSHFDTFYSNRYLTTLHLKKLHDWLAGVPYEHIIVLVNTDSYGGGGILNSYNLSMTKNQMFKPVVVHEFGHSFAGLADEYAYESEVIPMYPADVEPWEQNITTNIDFDSKWKDLLSPKIPIPTPDEKKYEGKIGLFEGAGYSLHGVFRPTYDCRMRTNENPEFCPVCQRIIRRVIEFYTTTE